MHEGIDAVSEDCTVVYQGYGRKCIRKKEKLWLVILLSLAKGHKPHTVATAMKKYLEWESMLDPLLHPTINLVPSGWSGFLTFISVVPQCTDTIFSHCRKSARGSSIHYRWFTPSWAVLKSLCVRCSGKLCTWPCALLWLPSKTLILHMKLWSYVARKIDSVICFGAVNLKASAAEWAWKRLFSINMKK